MTVQNVPTFTMRMASSALNIVRQTHHRLIRLETRLDELEIELDILRAICGRNVGIDNPSVKELLAKTQKFHQIITDLQLIRKQEADTGVWYPLLDPMVVHFRGVRKGEIIHLCLHAPETRVCHWHTVEDCCLKDRKVRRMANRSDKL